MCISMNVDGKKNQAVSNKWFVNGEIQLIVYTQKTHQLLYELLSLDLQNDQIVVSFMFCAKYDLHIFLCMICIMSSANGYKSYNFYRYDTNEMFRLLFCLDCIKKLLGCGLFTLKTIMKHKYYCLGFWFFWRYEMYKVTFNDSLSILHTFNLFCWYFSEYVIGFK